MASNNVHVYFSIRVLVKSLPGEVRSEREIGVYKGPISNLLMTSFSDDTDLRHMVIYCGVNKADLIGVTRMENTPPHLYNSMIK